MIDLYGLAGPLLRSLDAERAHGLAIAALKAGLVPAAARAPDPRLAQRLFGLDVPNPLGLAAGFDKNAEVPDRALALGFGFVEVGTVTPRPQAGNPRPRLFRLAADEAVINRMGFNGGGLDAALMRLASRKRRGIVGVNVGANKDSGDPVGDFARCAAVLAPHADYLVCNVSSPNTPGLRDLQGRARLAGLLERVRAALPTAAAPPGAAAPPLVIKIAPDLTDADLADVVEVALAAQVAAIIVGNTTVTRPPTLRSAEAREAGGLSGRPLFALSTEMLRKTYRLAAGRMTLIGCGGIASAEDAYTKIRAGASLLQLYTALVYRGPALVGEILDRLPALLARDGFASIADAVGADHR